MEIREKLSAEIRKVMSAPDLKEQSWGFFRVEKIRDPAEGALMHGPLIEFYLYREGE